MNVEDKKQDARQLFIKGYKAKEIGEQLGIPKRTVYSWISKEQWGELLAGQDLISAATRRLLSLFELPEKTDQQLKEIDTLTNSIDKLEKIKLRAQTARSTGSDDSSEGKAPRRKRGNKKNDFRNIDENLLMDKFREGLFAYQLELWAVKDEGRRNILKSRQIGLTWYFAREAFCDALLNGKNKVFISASKRQAGIFRNYIKAFAWEWFEIELKGTDDIILQTRHGLIELHFLSTNSSTAQGYTGDLYVDEYFWIPNFKKLTDLAKPIASHKKWRTTYFSTPSSKSHEAYPMWSGDKFNDERRRKKQKLVEFPSDESLRKQGQRCPDGQYRRVITLEDAIDKGCDLFDIEDLKLEYGETEFLQVFMCKFIDDSNSVFRFPELTKCMVESDNWEDFNAKADRPYALPVWIGYDPSRTRDGACIVVVAPPLVVNGKFRVLEKITLHGERWEYQAAVIEELTKKYNVAYIGVDLTGEGSGVFEMVQQFYPRVTAIRYSNETKNQLIMKAVQVISNGRIEWDSGYSDIAAGFMQIRKTVSNKSDAIIYVTDRTDKTGHADAAWAIMHTLIKEGLINVKRRRKSRLGISN